MFKKIKEFFVGVPPTEKHPLDAVTKPTAAPYKVETPAVEAAPVVEQIVDTSTAKAVQPAPVVKAAPAKKPRAPKAEAVVKAVKEKAPAKAKAPKAPVAKKPAARTAKSKKI
jgi:hypothetical protein